MKTIMPSHGVIVDSAIAIIILSSLKEIFLENANIIKQDKWLAMA